MNVARCENLAHCITYLAQKLYYFMGSTENKNTRGIKTSHRDENGLQLRKKKPIDYGRKQMEVTCEKVGFSWKWRIFVGGTKTTILPVTVNNDNIPSLKLLNETCPPKRNNKFVNDIDQNLNLIEHMKTFKFWAENS